MFSVGDLVVHPMHGAGVIDAIVQEKVAGSTQDYYVFKMPVGGLLLKIPTANSQAIGVRSVIQRPEAEALIDAIPSLAVEESSNWNKRYRENLLRMCCSGRNGGACPTESGRCSTTPSRSCCRSWCWRWTAAMRNWRNGWNGPCSRRPSLRGKVFAGRRSANILLYGDHSREVGSWDFSKDSGRPSAPGAPPYLSFSTVFRNRGLT